MNENWAGYAQNRRRKIQYPRYPNLVEGLEVVRPDQIWVSDITYIRLRQEFVYLAVIMDVFTRAIRGWHLDRSLGQALTLTALDRALKELIPIKCPVLWVHLKEGVSH